MPEGLKHKVAKGILWSSVEKFSTQGVTFVLGILIARQLSPDDYGVIAMLAIFFSVCGTLVDSGFSTALIRKTDRTESDNSTVFYFNIAVGLVVSLLLFVSAPLIAHFYDTPLLVPVTQVLSVTVFISSFGTVQQALLTSRIDFKTQSKISLTTTLLSGILGVWGAYEGFGVWALVWQMLSSSILRSVLLWIFVRWRPTMPFSVASFRGLFAFGLRLLASSLLDAAYNNSYTLVIGKFFSAPVLGNYSRANQFVHFPSSNISAIIQRVTFPALSAIQNEDARLASSYRRLLRFSAFIVFPLMIGLAAVAKPMIVVFLSEKWLGAAVILQIICFSMMWFPIHAINLNLLQIKGRSDLFLRLEVIKKMIGVTVLCITIPLGIIAMCYGQVFTSLVSLIVNTHYTGKIIQVGYVRQVRDFTPALFAALVMGAAVLLVQQLFVSASLQLGVGIIVGGVTYLIIIYLFRFSEVGYVRELLTKR